MRKNFFLVFFLCNSHIVTAAMSRILSPGILQSGNKGCKTYSANVKAIIAFVVGLRRKKKHSSLDNVQVKLEENFIFKNTNTKMRLAAHKYKNDGNAPNASFM